MADDVLIERPQNNAGVQVIRLNRPHKKNAITKAMYAEMTRALTEAASDAAVRVTAFVGSEGCFCAGNDMADFMAVAMGGTMGSEVIDFLKALAGAPKPLVSGVDGLAIGIGATLHLHCDLTVASARSVFRTPFVDLGLVPEAASSLLVPRLAGHQRAFALLVAGEEFTAAEARDAGLIWKIVDADAVEEQVLSLATNLAKKPPEALRIARQLIRGDQDEVLSRIDEEAGHFAERLKTDEAKSAFERFLRRAD